MFFLRRDGARAFIVFTNKCNNIYKKRLKSILFVYIVRIRTKHFNKKRRNRSKNTGHIKPRDLQKTYTRLSTTDQ